MRAASHTGVSSAHPAVNSAMSGNASPADSVRATSTAASRTPPRYCLRYIGGLTSPASSRGALVHKAPPRRRSPQRLHFRECVVAVTAGTPGSRPVPDWRPSAHKALSAGRSRGLLTAIRYSSKPAHRHRSAQARIPSLQYSDPRRHDDEDDESAGYATRRENRPWQQRTIHIYRPERFCQRANANGARCTRMSMGHRIRG
jgi:hypothetical protein